MRNQFKNLTTRIGALGSILAAIACMNEDATAPTAEPDLATVSAVQPKIAFVRNSEIFVMNADGTGQRRLTFAQRSNQFPLWSPNSQQILFTSCWESDPTLMIMNADGTNQRPFAAGLSCGVESETPAWSPDGGRVAYVNTEGFLSIRNTNGTGTRKLSTNESETEYEPAWSPDGRRIAFERWADVYIINVNGTGQRRLTTNEPKTNRPMPRWSPNSGTIAFVSGRNGNAEIYKMKADGTAQIRLTNAPGRDRYPAWSPDGRKIAFTSERNGNPEIYVMNVDGTRQTRLTRNSAVDANPKWSPDGTKIFFTSTRNGNADVYSMNADGTRQVNLSKSLADDTNPNVSR